MKDKLIFIVAVAAVIALVGIVFPQHTMNKAIAFEETVETALSDVNVQEKRRVDLVYNLADCVKQYDKYEADILKELADNMKMGNDSGEDVMTSLKAISYSYPELQSQKNYQNLMTELALSENLISQARQNYNQSVSNYRQYVRKFPHSFFLSMTGYEIKDYSRMKFEVSEDAPRDLFGN